MKRLVLLFIPLFFLGCATTMTVYRQGFPAKDKNAEIEIYDTKTPTRDYIEIARIDNSEGSVKAILEKARQIGADAVIISYYTKQSGSVYKGTGYIGTSKVISGVAIKYK